jgi:SAM-dependent methyltransferase
MLEIGCVEGQVGRFARERNLFHELIGFEIHEPSSHKAQAWFDRVICADIEEFDLKQVPWVDAILIIDVLEHLVDPWSTFCRLVDRLEHGGYVILSIPNARHFRVWGNLVLKGRFDYEDFGVLDRGHLRFFALPNLLEMFEQNKLCVETMRRNMAPWGRRIHYASLGLLRDFATFQFVFKLRKKH